LVPSGECGLRLTSARGAAILLAANVESAIEAIIESSLPLNSKKDLEPLYARDGALSSLYSKIHLGYAMGLYDDKIRDDLNVIRRVRNAFAHTRRPIDFGTPEISDECRRITSVNDPTHPASTIFAIDKGNSDERSLYIMAGLAISKYLLLLARKRSRAKARIALRKLKVARREAEALQREIDKIRAWQVSFARRMSALEIMMSEQERNEILEKWSLVKSQSDCDAVNAQLEALAVKYRAELPPCVS
jgi:DNA-binding MltR family transcriptional regulator